ncbi:hypothetical protein B841_00795 [Corynebacterium maris DSM 45190]|uniref:Methyltransferase type 11 domain-containing protein n=1 Tax=Corynebacterium maris DSM 45190 TaxID=1224163 RepID=S5SRL1_9CORY|nr:class I SAM-dependent methyltransferase [Corynebacterium maris]AGS33642.1 hypothetical protein B841_00795 [Corynebacterium maris DSM 45190]
MTALFDDGADYAAHRPSYPPALAESLAALPDGGTDLALDVGCGTGQLTALLAQHVGHRVIGVDPSPSQIAAATPAPKALYRVGSADRLPAVDGSVDLITVAQAAHWIDDLAAFYAEARRVATPGAAIALVSYGLCDVEGEVNSLFQDFYWGDFHRFWDPRRRHVENGLADLDFPFEPLRVEQPAIVREYDLTDFLGYLGTWTAVRNARDSGHAHEFAAFSEALSRQWGDPARRRTVTWPIAVRAGKVQAG